MSNPEAIAAGRLDAEVELKRVGGDASTARRFHEATKHSPESVRRRGHTLDWSNKPDEFKRYLSVRRVPLPEASPVETLALAAGVHHRWEFGPGEQIHFRNYASAGALYPVEAYLADAVASSTSTREALRTCRRAPDRTSRPAARAGHGLSGDDGSGFSRRGRDLGKA